MPCPIGRDIGELLNLTAGSAGNRAGTAAAEAAGSGGDVADAGSVVGGGGKKGGRSSSSSSSSSLSNRWLHDVLEVAETLKAERVEIVLDEKVRCWLVTLMG